MATWAALQEILEGNADTVDPAKTNPNEASTCKMELRSYPAKKEQGISTITCQGVRRKFNLKTGGKSSNEEKQRGYFGAIGAGQLRVA